MFVLQQPAKKRRTQISWLFVVVLLQFWGPFALAQSQQPDFECKRLGDAPGILLALYPELSAKHLNVTYSISTDLTSNRPLHLNEFEVSVSQFPPNHHLHVAGALGGTVEAADAKASANANTTYVSAGFWFDTNGRLVRFSAVGDLVVKDSQNKKVREVVDAHPDWSDGEIAKELKAAGAKFGPSDKEALLSAMDVDAFASFLGKTSITSTHFNFRDPETANRMAMLNWVVELVVSDPSGSPIRYFMSVEPFAGKITFLARLEL
jgi:hypothetical protein